MQLGFHFMNFAFPGGPARIARAVTETARAAEDAGAQRFTVMDHYFQMEQLGGPAAPMIEGRTTLGRIAAQTRNVRLGLLVTGVSYRHPGLFAKMVSTLDVLSGGRAMLGIGAAWYEREHDVLARHRDTEGRDWSTIQKAVLGTENPPADPDAFLAEMERYTAIGIDHVQIPITPAAQDPTAFVEQVGEKTLPRLADIGAWAGPQ